MDQAHSAGLLDKLRSITDLLVAEYLAEDALNVAAGGEGGAIIFTVVDEHVMQLLETLREIFGAGLRSGTGFFGAEKPLISLLSDITLKTLFQGVLSLGKEVDALFEGSQEHLEMAWFIMALNDLALPQYIQVIQQNQDMAKQYYLSEDSPVLSTSPRLIDMIHDLEKVYFQLEYSSYAEAVRARRLPGRNGSQQSIRSSLVERPVDAGQRASLKRQPLARSPRGAPSVGDSQSLGSGHRARPPSEPLSRPPDEPHTGPPSEPRARSTNEPRTRSPSEPRISSPLKQTLIVPEGVSDIETSVTATQASLSEGTLTTLSTALSSALSHTADETALSSDLGFFGFHFPGVLHRRPSILAAAMGFFGRRPSSEERLLGEQVPGDFEDITRTAEKERTRLMCTGSSMIMEICPIRGLAYQKFKCKECSTVIEIADYPKGKLCEVSGFYYCPDCHQDDSSISPALIINNWNFQDVRVSRSMYTLLGSQCRSEVFDLESLNPELFKYVGDLQLTKGLRFKLVELHAKVGPCQSPDKEEIMRRVWPREHLIETINLYTIEDLIDVHQGKLVRSLQGYLASLTHHVLSGCPRCSDI